MVDRFPTIQTCGLLWPWLDGGADSLELFSRGCRWKRLCLPFGKETMSSICALNFTSDRKPFLREKTSQLSHLVIW